MPEPTNDFTATARLIAPRLSLASCVRAYVTRSTLGRPLQPPEQRLNHFPANVHCGITWFIQGASQRVEPESEDSIQPLPPVAFGGPQDRPFVTYNPDRVQVFMVMFFPQALHALTGIDMSLQVNRIVSIDEVLDGPWLALSRQVMNAPDDDTRIALVEQFLEPLWRAARAGSSPHGVTLCDWVNSFGAHAAAAGWGRSARNLERRIKAWAGQPLRTLRRMTRAEQSFLEARSELLAGRHSWAESAARSGYADQSHLCREMREVTGHSPTELARKTRGDEGYWVYRIWL